MTLPVDFEKLWKEELKNREGNYNLRIIDDEVEKEFWHEFMKKRQNYAQDPWAVPIWKKRGGF